MIKLQSLNLWFFLQLYDKIRKSEQKYKVALEVLSYHNQCSDDEYQLVRKQSLPSQVCIKESLWAPGLLWTLIITWYCYNYNLPLMFQVEDIPKFSFSPWSIEEDRKALYVVFMFKDLFGLERYGILVKESLRSM